MRLLKPPRPRAPTTNVSAPLAAPSSAGTAWSLTTEMHEIVRTVGTEHVGDDLVGVGPGLVHAVVRVELRTVLVEVVPGVHDLEDGPVGCGLDGGTAQRQAARLRAVDADDDPDRVGGGVGGFVRHADEAT